LSSASISIFVEDFPCQQWSLSCVEELQVVHHLEDVYEAGPLPFPLPLKFQVKASTSIGAVGVDVEVGTLGVKVFIFLVFLSVILYFAYKRQWKDVDH
jgi:hypothetical protein